MSISLKRPGYINGLAAHATETQAAVKARAEEVAAKARALAAGHGGLAGCIYTRRPTRAESKRPDIDMVVALTRPDASNIEWGHYIRKHGEVVGHAHGLFVMTDAAKA